MSFNTSTPQDSTFIPYRFRIDDLLYFSYMEHIDRIGGGSYMPTDPDILHSRSQTV
jgi:hypothetical protein